MDTQNMKKIIAGYISLRHIEVRCTNSKKNMCIVGFHQKVLFQKEHAKTQLILALHFITM